MKRKKLFADLFKITEKKNLPLSCFFEITFRCNLNCIHCYNVRDKNIKELTTEKVKDTLNQLKGLNCLFLTFTGGEPFVREDFLEILEHSRSLNFATRVFTNGTLITEEIVKFLSKIGIYEVGVSLYSANKNIHEEITQLKGSYDATINTLKLLTKYNIKARIKCSLMTLNYKNYNAIIKLAEKLGVSYHFDPTIVAKDDGDTTPHKYRVEGKELKTLYRRLYQDDGVYTPKNIKIPPDRTFICAAGINSFDISPTGNIYPCLQWRKKLGNIKEDTLFNIWYNSEKIKWIRALTTDKFKICRNCSIKVYCPRCSGIALVEDKSSFGISSRACEVARIRKEIFDELVSARKS